MISLVEAALIVAERRLCGDAVGGAVDVGVELLEVLQHRPGHLAGSLRGVRGVEVGDACLEDWEVLADRRHVKGFDGHGHSGTST
jgi:hypothetical protein